MLRNKIVAYFSKNQYENLILQNLNNFMNWKAWYCCCRGEIRRLTMFIVPLNIFGIIDIFVLTPRKIKSVVYFPNEWIYDLWLEII